MIHVEKKKEKEIKQTVAEQKKVETPIKKESAKKVEQSVKNSVSKKEVEPEDKFNGLHAYALVIRGKFQAISATKNAIVTARTEETAKNRVKKEYPETTIVSIKRIPDEEGHKILKRVRNKAGIFFEEK